MRLVADTRIEYVHVPRKSIADESAGAKSDPKPPEHGRFVFESGQGHMPTETREVMDIREAAVYLGISVDTMYKYAANGIVPGFKIGGRIWRFKKSKVDEWMDQQSDNQGEIK